MKTVFQNYTITAKLAAQGVQFPNDNKSSYAHNKFRISVKNNDTGIRVGFDFYGSEHDYRQRVVEMNESDLKHGFYCLVSDGLSGLNDFEEFCSEFGYDVYSRNAKRIHKACVKQYEKAAKLVDSDSDLYDLANALND